MALLVLAQAGPAAAAPGDLDPAFGNGGLAGQASESFALSQAVLVQPDGRILVAGSPDPSSFGLVRYLPDGTPDNGFGTGGQVATALGVDVLPQAMILQPDGRIVLAGRIGPGKKDNGSIALVRYLSDGRLDPGFGTDGIARTVLPNKRVSGEVHALLYQPDGKLLAGGFWGKDAILLRYKTNGRLDRSFGQGGVIRARFAGKKCAASIAGLSLQADGRILAAGISHWPTLVDPCSEGSQFVLARWLPNGKPDKKFGKKGRVLTEFPGFRDAYAARIVLQPDGKPVVAGDAIPPDNLLTGAGVLARYHPDGTLDASFGQEGRVVAAAAEADQGVMFEALAVQPDGKLIAGGIVQDLDTLRDYVLARYHSDGSPDAAFGTQGRVVSSFLSEPPAIDNILDLAIQPDGKLLAAVHIIGGYGGEFRSLVNYAVARFELGEIAPP